MEQVPVHGRPAALALIAHGGVDRGWYLQAQFPDGTALVVQAPETLAREQVQIAEQITDTP
ncbi:MAG TPA: hypothetical protein VJ352_10310 [Geodermatophilus sp.]|nr:hypothetical protein [Geodermatophilus sp.]